MHNHSPSCTKLSFSLPWLVLGLFALVSVGCEEQRFRTHPKRRAPNVRARLPSAPAMALPTSRATARPKAIPAGLHIAPKYGHSEPVRDIAVGPSGLFAVSVSDDRQILSWKLPHLVRQRAYPGLQARPDAVAMGPSGRRFVVLAGRTQLLLYARSGKLMAQTKAQTPLREVEFAPLDNKIFGINQEGELLTYHGSKLTLSARRKICVGQAALSLEIDPQQRLIAVVCGDGRLWLSSYDGKQSRFFKQPEPANAVTFSPSGNHLVTTTTRAGVFLWKLSYNPFQFTLVSKRYGHVRRILRVRCAPRGGWVATGGLDRTINIWKITPKGLLLKHLLRHDATVSGLAFLPESETLLASDWRGRLRLWDVNKGERIGESELSDVRSMTLSFAPKAPRIAMAAAKGAAALWDFRKGTRLLSMAIQPNHVLHVEHAIDGNHFLSVDPDNAVFWDLNTRRAIDVIRPPKGSTISAAALGRDWTEVLYGTPDRGVQLWTIRGGPNRLYRHSKPKRISTLSVHALRRRALVGTLDGKLYLYNIQEFQLLKEAAPTKAAIRKVHFSPDGKRALVVSGKQVLILALPALKVEARRTLRDEVFDARFAPDAASIALASADTTVHLWKPQQKTSHARFSGCRASVRAVAFAPKAPLIAGLCRDGVLHLWSRKTKKPLVTFVPLEKKHWLVYNPSLFLTASDKALQMFSFAAGNTRYPLKAFQGWFLSSTKLQRSLESFFKQNDASTSRSPKKK